MPLSLPGGYPFHDAVATLPMAHEAVERQVVRVWIKVNTSWHLVAWTDPDYISVHGEMLHKTRCGLLKIRPQKADFPYAEKTCSRCLSLMEKDAAQ